MDRQLDQLLAAGASQIYKEKVSGSTRQRPQLEEVLRYLRKGDQLIVTSMGSPRALTGGPAHDL
uniref:recombinase family protein n=1 Tax=Helicobacter pylori TaxID=210 RepID=UPI0037BFC63D